MSQINLLPLDLSPNRKVVKLAVSLQKVNVVLMSIFLIALIFAVGIIVYLRTQITGSLNNQQQLTRNIQNLEATEQQLFLTKDRIAKIQTIVADSGKIKAYEEIDKILSSLPGNVIPYNVEVDVSRTQFSVLSKDSLAMAEFLNLLVTNGSYKKLKLNSFIYSPTRGYLIAMESS